MLMPLRYMRIVPCMFVLSGPPEPLFSVVSQSGDVHHDYAFVGCLKIWCYVLDPSSYSSPHIVALLAAWNLQHDGSDGRFRARGGRRRKLFGRALRVCRPRLGHSAASATSRGSKSTTDRLAASGLRRSRGHAQPADQRLPIVDLKAEMGSVVDARTISGACCTFP